jgi:hypothetical protein
MPWLLVVAWRLLDPDRDVRRHVGLFGLIGGFVTANANPAYLLVWSPLIVTVLAQYRRTAMQRAKAIAAAAAISLAIAAPIIVQLVAERPWFAGETRLANRDVALPWAAAWEALVAPVAATAQSRSLFFGGPFAVLALAGGVAYARARLDLVGGALVTVLLLFTTLVPVPLISARYQFRDVLTFCAILLAALFANDRLRAGGRTRDLVAAALVLQVGVIAVAAWPFLARVLDREGRQAIVVRGATGDGAVADTLLEHMPRPGRLLYSPDVDADISRLALVIDGLGMNALAYRGVAVVNGSFKGASAYNIWPNDLQF